MKELKITYKDILFNIFGIVCKLTFYLIAVIYLMFYNKNISILLISIVVIHNIVTILYRKRLVEIKKHIWR